MPDVKLLHDWSAVAKLRDDWRRLHAATPAATFFQSLDWLETYWKFYGEGQMLRVFAIREAGEVSGIVPLVILEESSKLGPLRILTYPLAYWGSYYGPIGPRPRQALAAAIERLSHERHDWDLFDLRFAPAAARDNSDTLEVMTAAGFEPAPKLVDHTSFIDLPGTFDGYLATRPAKWRTNYRRWLRRLHERGTVRYERYCPTGTIAAGSSPRDADPRWDLYDACESIARKSWQGSSTTGTTLTHPSIRPFLRAMHETACRAGAADIHLLYLDHQPLAFLYAYRCGDTMYGLRIGFDATLSKDGVGNIMYMHALEDSIRRGIRTFDLGPGSLKAKESICSRIEPIYRLPYANAYSWRGFAWRMKQTLSKAESALAEYNADFPSHRTSHETESPKAGDRRTPLSSST